jgi:hypothetical protein
MKEQSGQNRPSGGKILLVSPTSGSKVFPTIFADFGGPWLVLPKE